MRFDINLASRPFRDTRSTYARWGAVLGGVVCITIALMAIAFHNWSRTREINRSMVQVQQQIQQLDQQKNANEALLNQSANRDTRQRSQFLNGLIVRKSFSWTRAFSDLEKIMPTRAHLLKIEPESLLHEPLQFLDPVLHQHHLRHPRWWPLDFLDQEKALAVSGDVVIAEGAVPPEGALEQHVRRARGKRWRRRHRHGHDRRSALVVMLDALARHPIRCCRSLSAVGARLSVRRVLDGLTGAQQ